MEIGDYVFGSRWSDGNPNDPWIVGFIESIIENRTGKRYVISGSKREWKNVKKISQSKGDKILKEYPLKSKFNQNRKMKNLIQVLAIGLVLVGILFTGYSLTVDTLKRDGYISQSK